MIFLQMEAENGGRSAREMAASPFGIVDNILRTRNANQVRKTMDSQIRCHPPSYSFGKAHYLDWRRLGQCRSRE